MTSSAAKNDVTLILTVIIHADPRGPCGVNVHTGRIRQRNKQQTPSFFLLSHFIWQILVGVLVVLI